MDKKVIARETYESRYKSARANILFVIGFTVLNIVLLLFQSDSYFLFSACIPYLAVDLGMILCGIYPETFYVDDFADANLLASSAFSVFPA